MNDTATLDKNPIVPGASVGQVQPQMGSLNKEQAPKSQDLSEFIRQAGPESSLNVSQEEKTAGVEVKSNRPELTSEHKELVAHAGPDVSLPTSSSVTLPMTEEEIAKELKTGHKENSGTWLAALIDYVIKKSPFSDN